MSADLSALISAFANVLLTITAGIALLIAWRQVRVSHEISALEAYENYHLTSLQYPQFASGMNFEEASTSERECYTFFVSYALMTGERIIGLFPGEESWAKAICDDIRIHRRFIASRHFEEYLDNQTDEMKRLIGQVLAEPEETQGNGLPDPAAAG